MAREKKLKIIRDKLKDQIKDIQTLFETEEEKEGKKTKHKEKLIKDRIIRDIRTLSEQQQDYYDPKRVSNFSNNNYIEYESNRDKNRNLSHYEYLKKIKLYQRNIINLQNSGTRKIQLTIPINLFLQKILNKSV